MQGRGPPKGSLRDLLASPAVLAIVVVNFVNHWGYFIYLNWMPSFFYKVLQHRHTPHATRHTSHVTWQALGLDLKASSFLSLLPWVVMAIGSSVAGVLADALVKVR